MRPEMSGVASYYTLLRTTTMTTMMIPPPDHYRFRASMINDDGNDDWAAPARMRPVIIVFRLIYIHAWYLH